LLAANEALQGEIEQRTAMEKEREKIRVKAMTQGKLASLGEIATGVAHEINQPLTYLRIIFDSILRDMERDRLDLAELGEECRESLRQISRISVIIDHLRVFGRAKSMDRVEVRIDRVVRDSLVLMRERLRTRKILLDNRLDASLPAILGNAVKLEEVFLNLFQNAIDALEGRDNGVICIEASLEEEGKMLRIRFTDNGPGIPEEIREKIFEPFFTTKEVGKGTGLGLSIVFGIVKEHGGAIECESAPGEFTTFVITLPVGHPFGEEPDAD
jgi:C4-dicarboxylate-specific signal transduction histidine kinase